MSPDDPNYHKGEARLSRFIEFVNQNGLPDPRQISLVLYGETELIAALSLQPPKPVMRMLNPKEVEQYLASVMQKIAKGVDATAVIYVSFGRRGPAEKSLDGLSLSSIPADMYAFVAYDSATELLPRVYAINDGQIGKFITPKVNPTKSLFHTK